eukprot:g2812.t1
MKVVRALCKMDKYKLLGVAGEGQYGTVYRAQLKGSKQLVAIKKFKGREDDATHREIELLQQLKHPNIVSLREKFRVQGKLHIVFEYVPQDMLAVLGSFPAGIPQEAVKSYIRQLCRALVVCHARNICHRDVKPENLLVAGKPGVYDPDEANLKLCDFGVARFIHPGDKNLTGYVSTRWYRAPELLTSNTYQSSKRSRGLVRRRVQARYRNYSPSVDIWAVGCVMAELLTARPLFPGSSAADQLDLIRKYGGIGVGANPNGRSILRERMKGKVCAAGFDFMCRVLNMTPSQRPTARESLEHEYLQDPEERRRAAKKAERSSKGTSKATPDGEIEEDIVEDVAGEAGGINTTTESPKVVGDDDGSGSEDDFEDEDDDFEEDLSDEETHVAAPLSPKKRVHETSAKKISSEKRKKTKKSSTNDEKSSLTSSSREKNAKPRVPKSKPKVKPTSNKASKMTTRRKKDDSGESSADTSGYSSSRSRNVRKETSEILPALVHKTRDKTKMDPPNVKDDTVASFARKHTKSATNGRSSTDRHRHTADHQRTDYVDDSKPTTKSIATVDGTAEGERTRYPHIEASDTQRSNGRPAVLEVSSRSERNRRKHRSYRNKYARSKQQRRDYEEKKAARKAKRAAQRQKMQAMYDYNGRRILSKEEREARDKRRAQRFLQIHAHSSKEYDRQMRLRRGARERRDRERKVAAAKRERKGRVARPWRVRGKKSDDNSTSSSSTTQASKAYAGGGRGLLPSIYGSTGAKRHGRSKKNADSAFSSARANAQRETEKRRRRKQLEGVW